MRRYLLSRAGQSLIALFALIVVVFLSVRASGDPTFVLLSPTATPADRAALSHALGLDKSLVEQFAIFVSNALHGDLGTSYVYRRPVLDLVLERLPATTSLAVPATLLSLVVGVPIGVIAAVRRGALFDRIAQFSAIVFMAAPTFWVGIMLLTVFGGYLRLLPTHGLAGPSSYILPVVSLALYLGAGMVRLTRSSMVEVLRSEYVQFARMRGLSTARVTWKHALKNALIPVITFSGIMLASLLNGTVVIEAVFGWPGVGSLALGAVTDRDFALLQGTVLLSGVLYILTALAVDLLYAYVDPRISQESRSH